MITHTTYKSYFIGFFLSIVLTLASYFIVTHKLLAPCNTYITISILAVVQLLVQIFYFLHIASEEKPRWNLYSMIFAILIVLIVIVGSAWVMYNMNANMIL